jgi:hypothetical protein
MNRAILSLTRIRTRADVAVHLSTKKPQIQRTCGLLLGDTRGRADSVYNDHVINHTQIARVCVVDPHASARFDRGLDYLTPLVQNVARSVEDITARAIRFVLADDECP